MVEAVLIMHEALRSIPDTLKNQPFLTNVACGLDLFLICTQSFLKLNPLSKESNLLFLISDMHDHMLKLTISSL